jgi:sensor domain CHASE-containing protein
MCAADYHSVRIRHQMWLVGATVAGALVAGTFAVVTLIAVPRFDALQAQEELTATARLQSLIDTKVDLAATSIGAYADWTDMRTVVAEGESADLVWTDMVPIALYNDSGLDGIVALDESGAIAFSQRMGDNAELEPVTREMLPELEGLVGTDQIQELLTGFRIIDGELFLTVARPIRDDTALLPPAGALLTFDHIDSSTVATLSDELGFPVRIATTDSDLPVHTTVTGANGEPVAQLVGDFTSAARATGLATVRDLQIAVAVGILLALAGAGIFIQRTLVRRVERLSAEIGPAIADAMDGTGAAISVTGRDELGLLARTIETSLAPLGSLLSGVRDGAELALSANDVAQRAAHIGERTADVAAATGGIKGAADQVEVAVDELAMLCTSAIDDSATASQLVAQLAVTMGPVREAVSMIDAVAAQTNLLALNATIEASRGSRTGLRSGRRRGQEPCRTDDVVDRANRSRSSQGAVPGRQRSCRHRHCVGAG